MYHHCPPSPPPPPSNKELHTFIFPVSLKRKVTGPLDAFAWPLVRHCPRVRGSTVAHCSHSLCTEGQLVFNLIHNTCVAAVYVWQGLIKPVRMLKQLYKCNIMYNDNLGI